MARARALLREPYRACLWLYLRLVEMDRMAQMAERVARLHGASLTAFAFHKPADLDRERRAIERDLGIMSPMEQYDRTTLTETAARMMHDWQEQRRKDGTGRG